MDFPHGLRLELDRGGLDPAQQSAVNAFLAETFSALPPKFRTLTDETIHIRFSDALGNPASSVLPLCGKAPPPGSPSEPGIAGRFRAAPWPTVELNVQLLAEILRGEKESSTFPCGHGNGYRLAKATLIHELSHAADSFFAPGPLGKFSGQPQFLALGDWDRPAWYWPAWRERNELASRSPDSYELRDPRESFAVNMEFFLLDPDYACRRPSLHAFLRDLFSHAPFPGRACQASVRLGVQLPLDAGATLEWRDFDPSRVYQIHYLLAEPGDEIASSWGHSMFRLVMCAPERARPGPDCLKDLKYHVVVSFRANVTSTSLSLIGGVNGKYPSQLFLLSLPQVQREYNVTELRDLRSFPLALDSRQKQAFLERVEEMYWGYRGRYFFVTNNCATESFRLLRGVLGDPRLDDLPAPTPIGLAKTLLRTGWIEDADLGNQDRALALGLYFPSAKKQLARSYAWVAAHSPGLLSGLPALGKVGLRFFLSQSTAESRRRSFSAALAALPPRDFPLLAAHYFVLENYFETKIETETFRDALDYLIRDPERLGLGPAEAAGFQKLVALSLGADPLQKILSSGGYGIPLAGELQNGGDEGIRESWAAQAVDAFKRALLSAFPRQLAERRAIAVNLRAYAAALGR